MSNPLWIKRRERPPTNPHLLVAQQRNLGINTLSTQKFSQTYQTTFNGNSSLPKQQKNMQPLSDINKDMAHTQSRGSFGTVLREAEKKVVFQKPSINGWSHYFNREKNKLTLDAGTKVNAKQNHTALDSTPKKQKPQPSQSYLPKNASHLNLPQTTPIRPDSGNTHGVNHNKQNQPSSSYPQKKFNSFLMTPTKSTRNVNLVGLNNLGNTCYMNSILQCLLNLDGFNQSITQLKSVDIPNNARVAYSYAKFAKNMQNSNKKSQNPAQLKMAISSKKPRFSGYSQQDAQQFLTSLLQLLSADLNRSKNPKYKQLQADLSKQSLQQISQQWWIYNKERQDSLVSDFFTGQLLSRVVCQSCQHQSIAFDNTWDYALNFSGSQCTTLDKMVQNFLREETISKDYYCSKCKNFKQCKRKLDFYRLPHILVLQLKRFSYGSKHSKHKINTKIKIQKQIDFSKYLHPSVATTKTSSSSSNNIYKLVGMVHHSGQIDFGHYTAECLHGGNNKWYLYNDSHVSETRVEEGQERNTPYLLFYTRKL